MRDKNERYGRILQSDFAKELAQDYPDMVQSLIDPAMNKGTRAFHDLIRMAKIDGIVRMDRT